MRTIISALGAALLLAGQAAPQPALAFDSSATAPAKHLTPEQAAAFGAQIEDELAAKGARVGVVFRTGRPREKLPEGISYTHGAFWVQQPGEDGRPKYAVYNLYQGDGERLPIDRSYLEQDGPTDFTRGSHVDDVAVIIPSPELQQRLLAVIDSPTYARMHNPSYSLVANPLVGRHQNCNTFMLDVIGAAAWSVDDPAEVRARLQTQYQPTTVRAGLLMRVIGPMADPRLKTDDQRGPIRTATYESIAAFMEKNGLLQESYVLNRAP
jgi:hypothetical protein